MSWTTDLVDHLCELKRAGWTFDAAWREAAAAHPAPRRDRGIEAVNLFEAARDESETISEFLHRACGDAWHGRRPELAALPALLVGGEVFAAAPGRQAVGRSRNVAA